MMSVMTVTSGPLLTVVAVYRQIDVLGQRTSKVFEVAEYVLPRFEVTVDLPPYATFDDTTVTATVHAK